MAWIWELSYQKVITVCSGALTRPLSLEAAGIANIQSGFQTLNFQDELDLVREPRVAN